MSGPEVDVVILTWNDGSLLAAAIDSVIGSIGIETNIIVVDNGSEPSAVVPEGVTLLRNEENAGVAAGRNQGIKAGEAPIVCLLDSDAELLPLSLGHLVDQLEVCEAGLVVPVFVGQEPEESAGRAPTLGRKLLRASGRTNRYETMANRPRGELDAWPVDFGIGACQVFRRDLWESVGGLDEDYFYGPEDVDFCLRVADAGGAVYQVAGAPVIHPPRRRHRRPINRAGIRHGLALARHLLKQRRRAASSASPDPISAQDQLTP